ncbi:glycosyl hydrolase [Pollutimonas sp. H1-120]|uniref:F510_1955 family glycosylhydrolase n=1 Tax=Pollutimonas sp. H1-120 TaxID=3148824 RepID=UPI003B519542
MIDSKTTVTQGVIAVSIVAFSALGWQPLAIAGTAVMASNEARVSTNVKAEAPIELMHIHGLSYSADGKQILIPSHNGIAVYAQGRWSTMAGPKHDYMGFSATRDALYSSGHPAPGSDAVNPFGLIKSNDGGKTWEKLSLEGESDFHTLATSYGTNAIYVFNHQANSRMKAIGIYFTESDGMTWNRIAANGLKTKVNSLAAHPNDAKILAVGAGDGLYLSRDGGNHFEQIIDRKQVLAQWFDLDGKRLWFSNYAGGPALSLIRLTGDARAEQIQIPIDADDAIAYIAQNPIWLKELAIATFKRSVYVSHDQGATWTQIAKAGATL